METFAALRLEIDSWRWQGVPFYIRAGKCLPVTCTEVVVRLRRAARRFSGELDSAEPLRFRISPDIDDRHGLTVMAPGEEIGRPAGGAAGQRHHARATNRRLRASARRRDGGDATLFAREDYVEEAWRIVDPVLKAMPLS